MTKYITVKGDLNKRWLAKLGQVWLGVKSLHHLRYHAMSLLPKLHKKFQNRMTNKAGICQLPAIQPVLEGLGNGSVPV